MSEGLLWYQVTFTHLQLSSDEKPRSILQKEKLAETRCNNKYLTDDTMYEYVNKIIVAFGETHFIETPY